MSSYVRPVSGAFITDDYAAHVARGSAEPGTDYAARPGTPVVSPTSGTVRTVKGDTSGAMGRRVIVELDTGYWMDVIHLRSVSVTVGQRVAQGQQLGTVGGSGYGSETGVGAHAHISLWTPGAHPGERWRHGIDPEAFFAEHCGPSGARTVEEIQTVIGAKVDGVWGSESESKLRAWQATHRLTVDGVWGPESDATAFPTITTTQGDDEMILFIQGKAGKRSGGLWHFASGTATFLAKLGAYDPASNVPLITSEDAIASLGKLYKGLPA